MTERKYFLKQRKQRKDDHDIDTEGESKTLAKHATLILKGQLGHARKKIGCCLETLGESMKQAREKEAWPARKKVAG